MATEYQLVIRRYAPFKSFGGGFEGDDRQFSTRPDATSRTIGTVTFTADGSTKPSTTGRSSGSAWVGPWAVRKGGASVITSVGQVRVTVTDVASTSTGASFTVQTSGNLPAKDIALKPGLAKAIDKTNAWLRPGSPKPEGTPDIDTYVDFKVQVSNGALDVQGALRGDSFPNAEVFLVDPKGATFPLLDYQTSGGVAGPLRLVIPHKNTQRAAFPSRRIPLQPDGSFVPAAEQQPVTVKET